MLPAVLQGAAAPRPDGSGPPEEVDIASAEASLVQYIGLLTVAVAAFVLLASQTWEGFKEGDVHWSALLGTLLSGYFTYKGAYYLMLQNYVDTIQRPQSRVSSSLWHTSHTNFLPAGTWHWLGAVMNMRHACILVF
jgi:hypothetical protein